MDEVKIGPLTFVRDKNEVQLCTNEEHIGTIGFFSEENWQAFCDGARRIPPHHLRALALLVQYPDQQEFVIDSLGYLADWGEALVDATPNGKVYRNQKEET